MTTFTLYRAAAAAMAFVLVGHTIGGMFSETDVGPAGNAVFASMKVIKFNFFGSQCTWYGFHMGFGLNVSLLLGLSSFMTWYIDALPIDVWPHVAPLAWALVAATALATLLSWMYFFLMPSISMTLATLFLFAGTLQKNKGSVETKKRS
ncbi:hypothetical protein VHEMI04416 [[Torrubiella] hemipterigena]|uniref:Uncharacterized protein n=1 Tax=[Torrubiella] hemipterigena TaxID=1531966 RepID=A0A0A1TE71_9HYPO|nr:hypothetical protein VHEMI04416 [[Torrubiella] hemipterigena]